MVKGPNFDALEGQFDVVNSNGSVTTLRPQKRNYRAGNQVMTEAAIDRSLTRDIYVSMGEPVGKGDNKEDNKEANAINGAWAVRVYNKPFVNWIWLGCVVMGLGGFVAVADKRYRRIKRPNEALQTPAAA